MPSAKKTPNIQLNQWVGEEYVKRQDFVDDNLKIDTEIGELKESIKNIDLVDSKVKVEDKNNKFEGTTLDKVLDEIDDKIVDTNDKVDNIDLSANKVEYTDTHTLGATNVQQAVDKTVNKVDTDIINLEKKIKESRTVISSTLLASKWKENTYNFEEEYPFSQYTVYVCGYADTASVAQRDAYSDAELASVLTDQSIKALGTKPTIDVPVVLEVVKKWQ